MSGFNKDWLALREPVDRRSRDPGLLERAVAVVGEGGRILDIGCGTGSTYRTLVDRLSPATTWTLFDYDERLLAEAERRHPAAGIDFLQGDLNDIASLPLEGTAMVTASALFDLCSPAFINRFVAGLREKNGGLYAALNYDGEMRWSIAHPLDEAVTEVFNDHQRTDKGFGMSAGPEAWQVLAERLEAEGFQVSTATSPWIMDAEDADLQRMFLSGVAQAVREAARLSEDALTDWCEFRLASIEATDSSCRVGHQDVLALP
jgi:SAM-dependent methyltransferase